MIAVYFNPDGMTTAQYQAVSSELESSGVQMEGCKHHSCFGEDGHLMVYEVWETKEAFEAFGEKLMPILAKNSITMKGAPDVMPVVSLEQP